MRAIVGWQSMDPRWLVRPQLTSSRPTRFSIVAEVKNGEDSPSEVPASAVELALANYLSNAIKYSDREREDRLVQIRAWLEPGEAEVQQAAVAVADNGIGVPVEARDHLFTPFFRVGGDSAVATEGTGSDYRSCGKQSKGLAAESRRNWIGAMERPRRSTSVGGRRHRGLPSANESPAARNRCQKRAYPSACPALTEIGTSRSAILPWGDPRRPYASYLTAGA